MCMLTYLPPMTQPNVEHLFNGAVFNQDGHGFAIVAGNRLIIRHSMDEWKAIETFAEMRAKHPNGPAMFHSRYGTAGTTDRRNCHPFRVGGDRRTVIGHNGILPSNAQPSKGDKRCDTRICAEEIMRGANLGSAKYRRSLGKWMTNRNKFVILTVNPRYKASAWIINESAGIWDDETGIWYSNDDYLPYTYATTSVVKGKWWDDLGPAASEVRSWETPGASPEHCEHCGSLGEIDRSEDMCRMCGTCTDCGMCKLTGLCQCYGSEVTSDEEHGADAAAEYWARKNDLQAVFGALPQGDPDEYTR